MKFFLLAILALLTVLMPVQGAQRPRPTMVMVIDDDPADLALADHYLRKFECVTITCGGATEALALLERDWFDVVFVDLWLQEMTGLEFVRQARPRNVRADFYLMSGYWQGKAMAQAMELGAPPIIKGGLRSSKERLHTFYEMLNLILVRKETH